MNENAISMKSLVVKTGKDRQGRVEANLENTSKTSAAPSLLLIFLHDREGRIRDRLSLRIPSMKPAESKSVSTFFRMKDSEFFSYSASIKSEGK